MCVCVLTRKVLPGLVRLPKVHRPLQNPKIRTGRVCELDQNVGNMEELQKEQKFSFTPSRSRKKKERIQRVRGRKKIKEKKEMDRREEKRKQTKASFNVCLVCY